MLRTNFSESCQSGGLIPENLALESGILGLMLGGDSVRIGLVAGQCDFLCVPGEFIRA